MELVHLLFADACDLLIGARRLYDLVDHALDHLRGVARGLLTGVDAAHHADHGRRDAFDTGIQVADDGRDLARGFGGTHRETAHLVGHHRKTAARLARARRLDGRVEREQIRLLGDGANGADDVEDLLRGVLELIHLLRSAVDLTHGRVHLADIAQLLRGRRHFLRATVLVLADLGDFVGDGRDLIGRLRHLFAVVVDVADHLGEVRQLRIEAALEYPDLIERLGLHRVGEIALLDARERSYWVLDGARKQLGGQRSDEGQDRD